MTLLLSGIVVLLLTLVVFDPACRAAEEMHRFVGPEVEPFFALAVCAAWRAALLA